MTELGPGVLYVIDSLAAGGAERSLAEVAPHLVRGGIRLHVAVLHDRAGLAHEIEAAGGTVTTVGGSSRLAWLKNLRGLIRRTRPDLVHTTLYDADQVGRVAAAMTRTPSVSSLVSVSWGQEHKRESGASRSKVESARMVDLATVRLARRLHAVSKTVAREVGPRLHVRPERIEVITRGRDGRRLGRRNASRASGARHHLGISGDEVLLVSLARHEPAKRLDVLIGAMPEVRRVHPRARLVVAGAEGRQTARLRAVVDELHLADVVTLLGVYDEVPDLLCAADLFVLPTMREGLPGSIVEAIALEAPVLASDIPAVREVVDESTAVLVPVGSPEELGRRINETLDDRPSMLARAAAGREVFEREFTIEVSARRWVEFYRSVV